MYKLTNFNVVVRTADGTMIPMDESLQDYREFLRWKAAGNEPLPVPPPPEPTPQEKIERLERTEGQGVYVRGIREFMLGIADGLATINPQLSQQMLATPGMRKVKELNDKITELRKQL